MSEDGVVADGHVAHAQSSRRRTTGVTTLQLFPGKLLAPLQMVPGKRSGRPKWLQKTETLHEAQHVGKRCAKRSVCVCV